MVNLTRAGLTDKGVLMILENMPNTLQELNLSGNPKMTPQCYKIILHDREYDLESLILENN